MLCHVLRDCWIEVKDYKSLYATQVKVMPVFVPHCISPTRIAEGMLQVIASVCVPSSCATHSNLARVTTPRVCRVPSAAPCA